MLEEYEMPLKDLMDEKFEVNLHVITQPGLEKKVAAEIALYRANYCNSCDL